MDNLHTKEVVTCEEMKQLEKMASEAGLSYYEMMENAGTKAARYILDAFHYSYGKVEKALILCGKGNNGGDDQETRFPQRCRRRDTEQQVTDDASAERCGTSEYHRTEEIGTDFSRGKNAGNSGSTDGDQFCDGEKR